MVATTSSSSLTVRAVTATFAPSSANASAIARPMPRPPPVTSATRFFSFAMTCFLSCFFFSRLCFSWFRIGTSAGNFTGARSRQGLGKESIMPASAWKQLLAGWPWFRGDGRYPLAAYSEFMPPPRLGRRAYCGPDSFLVSEDDSCGWRVMEYEEHFELRPGLETLAQQIVGALVHLGRGTPAHGISRLKLTDNAYWPAELAEHAGKLPHERYILLMPLALARTQDDKGRLRWTLFGGSEQGPARAFWRGFFTSPRREVPEEKALGFVRRLLHTAYGEPLDADLRRTGFRILPLGDDIAFPYWRENPLPVWTKPYIWSGRPPVRGVK